MSRPAAYLAALAVLFGAAWLAGGALGGVEQSDGTPAMAEHMPMVVGDLEMHMVAGSGHWTQQEKPEEVNRLILDWLGRRFPT